MGGDFLSTWNKNKINRPWLNSFYALRSRCKSKNGNYFRNNINFSITREQVKDLWIRDKAFTMIKPSIDRINTNGNYDFDNCRFIELSLNKSLPRKKPVNSKNKYKGVRWQEDHKKYRVLACKDGKEYHIGYFSDEKEAARIYNEFVSKIFGEKIEINKLL